MPSPAGPRRVLPLLLAVLVCALPAAAPAAAHEGRHVVIALLPVELEAPPDAERPSVLDLIGGHPELALGMTSATQSGYSPQQALLDLTAGTRTSRGTYDPKEPPDLGLLPAGGAGLIVNWLAAVARARTAPADVVPGLLADSVPGGAGYVGIDGRPNAEAVLAADREGRVAQVSLGEETTVAARTRALLGERRLVVVLLAPGYAGDRQLDLLLADRRPGELLIAMQAPPPFQGPQLLWTGVAGLGAADAGLTSATTHIDGVIAGIDVLPTVLGHLGVPVPDPVRGEPIRLEGARDADALQRLADRLEVVTARRIPTLQTFLFLWLGAVLLAGVLRDRAGVRFALRLGGLAIMWVPAMALVGAALTPPSRPRRCSSPAARSCSRSRPTGSCRGRAARRSPRSSPSSPTPPTSRTTRTSSSARCSAPARARARASTGWATSWRSSSCCWRSWRWRRCCAGASAPAAARSRSRSAASRSRSSSARGGSAPTSAGSSRSPAGRRSRRC